MIEACTIIAGNDIAAARVLADSFLTHHPDGVFTVLVVDDERRDIAPSGELDRRMSWWRLGDLGLDPAEIHSLAAIYDAIELSTAVKPLFLRTLMARGARRSSISIPASACGSLADVARLADQHGVVLTPHVTEPIPDGGRGVDARFALVAGVYNLGFAAVAPSAEPCLEWWWQRTRRRSLNNSQQPTFTDERWTDSIPSLFGHHLLKDPGCNVAYWNLHERPLTRIHGRVLARGVPLRFVNFSGFDTGAHQDEPRILRSEHAVAATLYEDYAAALDRAGVAASSRRRYGWDVSADGLEMTRRIRRLYWSALLAAERGDANEPPDPFDTTHPDAFTTWLNAAVSAATERDTAVPAAAPPPAPAAARPVEEPARVARTTARLARTWSDLRVSLVIGLCCLLVYNANGRTIGAGDTYNARYQPIAIWKYHTVLLDPIETLAAQGRERTTYGVAPSPSNAYWILSTRDGHLASLYPVVVPVLLAPLYLPAASYVSLRGWTDQRVDVAARIMEKLAASFVTALSASLLYLALRRRTRTSIAVLLTIAYAFGTSTWVVSSQALWQHGVAQLLVAGAILLLTGPCTAARALTVGLLCGLIPGNRPPDALLAAALGAYALYWAGRRAAIVIAAAAVPALLVLVYNVTAFGTLTGGYGQVLQLEAFFSHDLRSGVTGLLFSPTRGLFVFSPFLLFLVLAWRHPPHDRAERGLTLAMAAGVIVQLLLYSVADWRGGHSWGPRFLTDMLPMLIWLLGPVVAALGRRGRACFVAAVSVAIAIESVGAFAYTGVTDAPLFAIASGPDQLRAVWEWRNAPFIASLSRGFSPPELLQPMRGSLDVVEVDGRRTDTIAVGQNVIARGWALAGRATPMQVAITIDGSQTTVVRAFFDRSDVRTVFPSTGPAGWSMPLETAGLAPGQHRLSLYLWASENGAMYFLARRTLTVQSKDSDPGARVSPRR